MKKIILLFSLLTIINNPKTIGYCDIKGNVKNPGVYEIKVNQTIQDIIEKAGGLKKNSYTDNINLSKIVKDEMVIYIHSKKEINKINKLNNCDCSKVIKYVECDEIEENKETERNENIEPITSTTITTSVINIPTSNKTTKSTTTFENIITSKKEITNTTTQITTSIVNNINKKININHCTIYELMTLKGLGESKAKSIIDYRNINGEFKTIQEILNVNGIGNKTFENIKEYIEV